MNGKFGFQRMGLRNEGYPQHSTVFVDNLPDQIRKIWVYNLFSRFGKIMDLFIPNKKSKVSGKSFGFVRFSRIEDAKIAIDKVKDSWYWGNKLVVKFARFLRKVDEQGYQRNSSLNHSEKLDNRSKGKEVIYGKIWNNKIQDASGGNKFIHGKVWNNRQQVIANTKRGKEVWRKKGIAESSKQGEKRNIKVNNSITKDHMGSIKVQTVGNGWLFRSAVAKISKLVSAKDLEHVFSTEGVQEVQIKAIGGRHVIITFSNVEIRDSVIKKDWMSNWFEVIKPWEGEQANEERFVWLSCYGMPLNAWDYPTFKEIGNKWGQFLQVDESTLKGSSFVSAKILIATNQFQKIEGSIEFIVDKDNYSVRVVEEESFRCIKHSLFDIYSELSMKKTDNEEGDMADMESKCGEQIGVCNDVLENSKVNLVVEDVPILPINEAAEVIGTNNSSLEIDKSAVGSEIVADSVGANSNNSHLQSRSSKDLESNEANKKDLEESKVNSDSDIEEYNNEGNNDYDNNLDEPVDNPLGRNEEIELNRDLAEANHNPINAAVKNIQGKRNRKNINEILGFSKVNTSHKGKKNKKCVVLRSAIASAALSASISSEGINNRNKILLNEAKAIWAMDKIMGLSYNGKEEEVISKIAEMEALNKQRANCQS